MRPGTALANYEILGPLGAGAMGEVYRARDTRLDREVALKLLPDEFAQDEERQRRFEREAKSLASLNHPNVAQIHAVDRVGSAYFLVLELVEGETLETRLQRGALPVEEALELCRQIAEGLDAAHEAGVIHRDLKPANIRITPQGAVKVLDFGLAKPMRQGGDTKSSTDSVLSTEHGRLLGTPTYMAPEQARGKPIDRRVDLWAFGCVLYECLTAERAFRGETISDVLAAVLEREPDWRRLPAQLPVRVRELLERCLCKDSAVRQRGAGDAALVLRTALENREPTENGKTSLSTMLPWLVSALGVTIGAWGWSVGRAPLFAPASAAKTVRFQLALPPGSHLAMSDRSMNELAVSPDGSTIAYIVEQDGKTAMYARRLDEREARRLELPSTARGPTFSQDGTVLAFVGDFSTLMRTSLSGGPIEKIAATGGMPFGAAAYSVDEHISYACVIDGSAKRLMDIDMKTGASRIVAEVHGEFEGIENVNVSPELDWLLLDGWNGMNVYDYRIMSVDRASGVTRVLIERASGPSAVGGDILVFHRGASLFAVSFDFANQRALGEERMVVSGIATDRWGGSAQFAVSANGTLVYAPGKRRGEGRRLVWSNPDGSVEAITPSVDAFSDGVALCADGSRMLVRTIRTREELWTVDLVGGGMQPVIAGELFGAVLAPAGDCVIYGINLGASREVRRAPLDGGEHTVIWKGQVAPLCVSADGRQILVGSEGSDAKATKSDILLLDLRREPPELVPVIATPANEVQAQWSPDGNWLAYRSDSSGSAEVYVRAWPGGTRDWKVSRDGGNAPRWSADSRTLFYLDDLRLMAVDLQTSGASGAAALQLSAPREVMSDLVFAEAENYAIGPDGRVARIELAEWERAESHLEVVVGWLPELRRILSKQ